MMAVFIWMDFQVKLNKVDECRWKAMDHIKLQYFFYVLWAFQAEKSIRFNDCEHLYESSVPYFIQIFWTA